MDVCDAIRTRRAYRSLAPMVVDDALLEKLATASQLTASCFNNQPWRFVFVREPANLTAFHAALNPGNEWARSASMFIVAASKKEQDCVIKDREYYLFDTGMAVSAMLLQATELGLVAHPIAGYSPDRVRELLGIPPDVQVIAVIVCGKHAEAMSPLLNDKQKAMEASRPPRKELAEIAFWEKWRER